MKSRSHWRESALWNALCAGDITHRNALRAPHALMAGVLSKTEPEEQHLFDLLKRAYIDARYSMSYRISSAELATLQAQGLVLAARVRVACLEMIATFCGAELHVLRSRGVAVSAELEQHIMTCTDPAVLGAWLQRVATAASAAELLATDGSTH